MTKLSLVAAFAVVLATPSFAQVVETPTSTIVIVPPDAPGVVTPRPNSTGDEFATVYSPTGRASDGISSDSAAAGNEGQPNQVGSTSGGSGGGGH